MWPRSLSIVLPVPFAKAEGGFDAISFPGTDIALDVASAGEHHLLLFFYSTQKTRKGFCAGTMQVQKFFEDAKEGLCEARDLLCCFDKQLPEIPCLKLH